MHALVVVAHPDPNSLTHLIASRVGEGIAASGNSFEIADLAAERFDPRFGKSDIAVNLHQATPDADVIAEQGRIDRADDLVLVYPVERRFACRQRRIDDQVLALIEFLVERRQQSRARSEVIVDHGLGHRRLFRQPAERQRLGAFLPRNAPGDIEKLAMPLFP